MLEVIIVGGGASGLLCGIESVKRGKQCLIIEQKEKVGKKLYATGNGKCNFANRVVDKSCYHTVSSEDANRIGSFVNEQLCKQIEQYFLELGIPVYERQGYLYPRSEQAAIVVRALEDAFTEKGGNIHCDESVQYVKTNSDGTFRVGTDKNVYETKQVVLATGGAASPKLGSDGMGYSFAKSLGHTVTPCVPSLCGVKCKAAGWNRLQGVRAKGRVEAWIGNKKLAEDVGEIQFTQYGISGIVVFNLSRYAALGLLKNQKVVFRLDLLPDYSENELVRLLQNMQKTCGYQSICHVLSGFLPDKLAAYLLRDSRIVNDINDSLSINAFSLSQLQQIASACKGLNLKITETNSFDQAQVTAGGVPLKEINPDTMESKKVPGCYLVGELLDVDGICGGYNLMWAWETGRRAGKNL